jgi:hypothetical protein
VLTGPGRPGALEWRAWQQAPDLLAEPVAVALRDWPPAADVLAAAIDPALADTAAFCERYGVALAESANCVVVRRRLGARKASLASMDDAVALTGMEYGGITPIGLPVGWPVLVDRAVAACPVAVIGSGLRRSKLCLPGAALAELPGAELLDLANEPAPN